MSVEELLLQMKSGSVTPVTPDNTAGVTENMQQNQEGNPGYPGYPDTRSGMCVDERAAVLEWLNRIGETDQHVRRTWLEQCARDRDALHYTVHRLTLSDLESRDYAFRVANPNADPVRVTAAIRNVGTFDLFVPADRWNPWLLIKLLDRHGAPQ